MSSSRRRFAARRRDKQTGSPIQSEPVFVVVGIARKPHGLRGEMLVQVLTDDPERFKPGAEFLLGEQQTPVQIANIRQHNQGLLVAFEGFPTRESLEGYRNAPLFMRVEDLPPLPDGEYYQHQLLGLDVADEDGASLGTLHEVLETGANDIYLVRDSEGGELLLPAIKDVVLSVDLDAKRITVRLLPGLEAST